MDNLLGININTSCRFIQDQDINTCCQPFGHQHLLLVSTGEAVYQTVSVCRINAHLIDLLINQSVQFLLIVENTVGIPINNTGGHIITNCLVQCQTYDFSILCQISKSSGDSFSEVPEMCLFSMYIDFSTIGLIHTDQCSCDLCSSCPGQSADSKYFTLMKLEVYMMEKSPVCIIFNLQYNFILYHGFMVLIEILYRSSYHHLNQLVRIRISYCTGAYQLTISHNCNIVCDLKNLCQMMGNINHRKPLCLQLTDDLVKAFNLVAGKSGCGLIHNNNGWIKAKSFRNLDKLCFALADLRNIHSRINIIQSHSCKKFL